MEGDYTRFRHSRSHRDYSRGRRGPGIGAVAIVVALVLATGLAVAAAWTLRDPAPPAANARTAAAATPCAPLRVVTAGTFEPVLRALTAPLRAGSPCVDLQVDVADGRAAVAAGPLADVWIPDDASWGGLAPEGALDTAAPGAGDTLAQTPFYLVAGDPGTAAAVARAGGGWLGLAGLLRPGSNVRLVVPDPASSGDGMMAAGTLGEAVWQAQDMDASALVLATALTVTRTVAGTGPVSPGPGEVAVLTERALADAPDPPGRAMLAATDYTGLLRYAWFPTTAGRERAAAARALRAALDGPAGAAAIDQARLRGPGNQVPSAIRAADYPSNDAEPLPVLKPHHVDHVFATWYPQDRRTDLLVVVDVSGSMAARPPGSDQQLIAVVRDGLTGLTGLLPDDARVGLWEFGSRLQGDSDHRELTAMAPLTGDARAALGRATGTLQARRTGTGLYDTILAAYRAAVAGHRDGVPAQVLVFTDGRNEADPGSISAATLARELAAAADPARPVALSVAAFGDDPDVTALEAALEPVGGYVDAVRDAVEVEAVFVHVAAGGPHG